MEGECNVRFVSQAVAQTISLERLLSPKAVGHVGEHSVRR